jgi:hypothetical protein
MNGLRVEMLVDGRTVKTGIVVHVSLGTVRIDSIERPIGADRKESRSTFDHSCALVVAIDGTPGELAVWEFGATLAGQTYEVRLAPSAREIVAASQVVQKEAVEAISAKPAPEIDHADRDCPHCRRKGVLALVCPCCGGDGDVEG